MGRYFDCQWKWAECRLVRTRVRLLIHSTPGGLIHPQMTQKQRSLRFGVDKLRAAGCEAALALTIRIITKGNS